MKIAVMQPYFMPYIGYWQLINAVDRFVLLDDVNYITRGYINRNSILVNGKTFRFTIPIKKASQNKLIMNTMLNYDIKEKNNFISTLYNAYRKSDYYEEIMPIMEEIIHYEEEDLTKFILFSIEKVMEYLKINTPILLSSKIEKQFELKGEDRIIAICQKLGADTYINPSGGRMLYHRDRFIKENIELYFLDSMLGEIEYKQNTEKFIPNLSIIDVLMNASGYEINEMMKKYTLSTK